MHIATTIPMAFSLGGDFFPLFSLLFSYCLGVLEKGWLFLSVEALLKPDATRYAFMCSAYSSRRSWEFLKVGLLTLIATSRIYQFDDFRLFLPLTRRVCVVGGDGSKFTVSRWLGGRTLGKSRLWF